MQVAVTKTILSYCPMDKAQFAGYVIAKTQLVSLILRPFLAPVFAVCILQVIKNWSQGRHTPSDQNLEPGKAWEQGYNWYCTVLKKFKT